MTLPQKQNSNIPQGEQSPALKRYIERRDALNEIDLGLVLTKLGADPGQDGDNSKWKIPAVGNIIVKGQSWMNVNTHKKGFGGVQLVRHANDFEKEREAMDWLEATFGASDKIAPEIKARDNNRREKPQFFDPPERMDHLWARVRDYLTGQQKGQRGIPGTLIDEMHDRGTLYSTLAFDNVRKRHYGEPRAVFLGPASAEVREIVPTGFKGCTEGSDPERSCFQVPHADAAEESLLAIQEAAVDTLSYRALFPGRFCVSTNGVGRFPLQYRLSLEAMDNGYGVRLAFDADVAGDIGAQHVFNGLFARNLLSNRLGVTPETVDQWLLSGAIEVTPQPSPHHLFFSEGWKPALPVLRREIQTDEDGKVREVWLPTNDNASPTVHMVVTRTGLHDRLEKRAYDIPVTERAYRYITETLKLTRERPVMGKDWNDELNRLGLAYIRAYDRESKKDFVDGVPGLPVHLEKFRVPGMKVIPAPVADSIPPIRKVEVAPAPARFPSRPSFQR